METSLSHLLFTVILYISGTRPQTLLLVDYKYLNLVQIFSFPLETFSFPPITSLKVSVPQSGYV